MTRKSPTTTPNTPETTIEESPPTPETIIAEAIKRRPGRQPKPGNRSALGVSVGIKLYQEELDAVSASFPGATNAAAVLEIVKMFLSDTGLVEMTAEAADLRETVEALTLENNTLQTKIAGVLALLAPTE